MFKSYLLRKFEIIFSLFLHPNLAKLFNLDKIALFSEIKPVYIETMSHDTFRLDIIISNRLFDVSFIMFAYDSNYSIELFKTL